MRTRLWRSLALASIAAIALSGITIAYDPPIDDGVVDSGKEVHGGVHDQHGGTGGHLPATSSNVSLISKLRLATAEGRISDVGVWNGFAYLGAFRQDTCTNPENTIDGGVYIVDIRVPASPKEVGFLQVHQDSYVGEGVQALTITTPKFNGDILVLNSETCDMSGKGGFTLYDVTNPLMPMKLVENFGDFNVFAPGNGRDANDIHSAYAWDAGTKAYVVVVDDLETTDVDIFDITDPRHPFMVGEYDLNLLFPTIIQADLGSGSSFLHDMVVKKIGANYVMLLSYWDGGYVALNVNDPTAPVYIADTDFTNPDPLLNERVNPDPNLPPEGNGHQAEFSLNNNFVVAADEDFGPLTPFISIDGGDVVPFSAGTATGPSLGEGDTLAGPTRFVGQACGAVPAPGGADVIAVIERGTCTFQVKFNNVTAAGYVAGIVFNSNDPAASAPCEGLVNMLATVTIPSFFVARSDGFEVLGVAGYNPANCFTGLNPPLPAAGTAGLPISITVQFDGWGYVHLYSYPAMLELDTYAIPEAHDPAFASGFGDLSVHEVAMSAVRNDLAYFSYYAGGFRVARITGNGRNVQLNEVGRFIDAGGDGGNNFWGVQVFPFGTHEYVAASDRDFGLYIFEFTGP